MATYTIKIPGLADTALADGGYRDDEPQRWRRYLASRTAYRVGRGKVVAVTLPADDWADLAEYWLSLEGAMASGIGDLAVEDRPAERRALAAVTKACDAIAASVPEVTIRGRVPWRAVAVTA